VAWLTHRGEGYAYAFENPNVVRSAIDKRLVRAMRGLQARAKSHFSRR
jgi:hypothetical protein